MRGLPKLAGWTRLALLALAALPAAGCGYALVGKAQNLPQDVRKIYVQPLTNQTTRSQLDQFLTSAIANELLTRPRFSVSASGGEADAVLSGSVRSFEVRPLSYDAEGRATDYEILITASMALKRTDEQQTVLWENSNYLFREDYQLQVSPTGYFDQEDPAIRQAAQRFAETVITDLLERF
ncbi:MAG: LPS assembly lipoprotein LptE [Thermoanaerobaculia bacterium]